MTPPDFREDCARLLLTQTDRIGRVRAFVGLDGFVDEIDHVVDKRETPERYQRLSTIASMGKRIAAAAGHSTNVELVTQQTKLGGNGPILANALASFGLQVTYLGALGYPQLHPVFQEFSRCAQVHSIAEAGHTDALEFDDGKIMLTKSTGLNEVHWENICERFGADRFLKEVGESEVVAFVNWTMLPHLEEIWLRLQQQLPPPQPGSRPLLFIDLADPEKRTSKDLRRALQLVAQFEARFEVVLGLNEKEAGQVAAALQIAKPAELGDLAVVLRRRLAISQLLIHPVSYALLATSDQVVRQDGPNIQRPVLTTGGGDHLNAGFCLGHLLRCSPDQSLLLAVATSGFYVGHGRTPTVQDLAAFLRAWP